MEIDVWAHLYRRVTMVILNNDVIWAPFYSAYSGPELLLDLAHEVIAAERETMDPIKSNDFIRSSRDQFVNWKIASDTIHLQTSMGNNHEDDVFL